MDDKDKKIKVHIKVQIKLQQRWLYQTTWSHQSNHIYTRMISRQALTVVEGCNRTDRPLLASYFFEAEYLHLSNFNQI